MAEQLDHSPVPQPLEMNPDEWLELVDGVRQLPGIQPAYLTGTLGYPETTAQALFAELQAQGVIANDEHKGMYPVTEPEQFRRVRVAAGQVAVGSVFAGSRRSQRRIEKALRYTRNPYTWEELGEPSIPEKTTWIELDADAPRLERGETTIEWRRRAQEEAMLAARERRLKRVQGDPGAEADSDSEIDWRAMATDPQYLRLFEDPDSLEQLHKDIQEEAWPQYNERLAELNRQRASRGEPEIASVRDLPPHEKRAIIDPIDARLTREYAGEDVPPEVLRGLTLARLFHMGKLQEDKRRAHKNQRSS